MPKRKSPDKFRVGQRVILVLDEDCGAGWSRANGEEGVVIAPAQLGNFRCGPMIKGLPGRVGPQRGCRYLVRWRNGFNHFGEEHLRAVYDGEEVSTWEKFAKATGLDLAATCLVAKPIKARPRNRETADE